MTRQRDEKVVPLPGAPPPPAPPSPHPRGHGAAVTLMFVFAVTGIVATLAFVTVGWPEPFRRGVIAVILFAAVGFVACASIAVFTAAGSARTAPGGRDLE